MTNPRIIPMNTTQQLQKSIFSPKNNRMHNSLLGSNTRANEELHKLKVDDSILKGPFDPEEHIV